MNARTGLAYYRPARGAKGPKKVVSVRVPADLHANLEGLAQFWSALDSAVVGPDAPETDLSDVVIRLLEMGVDGAWAEIGGRPVNEKDRAALVKKAAAVHTK